MNNNDIEENHFHNYDYGDRNTVQHNGGITTGLLRGREGRTIRLIDEWRTNFEMHFAGPKFGQRQSDSVHQNDIVFTRNDLQRL